MRLTSSYRGLLINSNILFALWLGVFTLLRVINLEGTLLWADDLSTLPALDFVAWGDLPDAIYERLTRITGPILPTALDGVIVNLFGLSTVALRIPSVIVSIIGGVLLWRLLQVLFPENMAAQWVPLLLYTFSVPAIIYAQQIQPTAYYLMGSCAQLLAFIAFYRTDDRDPRFRRRMLVFIAVSTACFFINYLSVLLTGLLSAFWSFRLFDLTFISRPRRPVGRFLRYFGVYFGLHIPLFVLILNVPYELHPGRTYFYHYYFLSAGDFLVHSYDLVTYHFNYAYGKALYYPLTLNPASLVFVGVVGVGLVLFLRQNRLHFIYAAFTLVVLYFVARLAMYPYGGLRHSFTLAPILYIFVGYVVQALAPYRRVSQVIWGGVLGLAVLTWLLSGSGLYAARDLQLDSQEIIQIAAEYDIETILAHDDAYGVLRFQGIEQTLNLIGFGGDTDLSAVAPDERFLLVGMTSSMDPRWQAPFGLALPVIYCEACPFTITTLVDDDGPVPYAAEAAQAIYGPTNGRFFYLVEPNP